MNEHTAIVTHETPDAPAEAVGKVYVTMSTTRPIGFAMGPDGGGHGVTFECDETKALELAQLLKLAQLRELAQLMAENEERLKALRLL